LGGASVGQRGSERVRQKNAGLAAIVRAERDERMSKVLMKGEPGGGAPRVATEEERNQVAMILNQRMDVLFLDPQARSWYKLFCHMDDDLSGKVNFHEFEDMIRNELKVTSSKLSDEQLRAVWRSLDEDSSGFIATGEFGHFMRQGARHQNPEESTKAKILKKREMDGEASRQQRKEMLSTWRESKALAEAAVTEHTEQLRNAEAGRTAAALARVKQQNAVTAQVIRQERDERLSRHLMKKGDTAGTPRAASMQECEQFSVLLNQRMVEIFIDPRARSWYKLFVHMDDDLSGKINYHELEDMVRNELKVPNSRFSDEQLMGIWNFLDEDRSGLITIGEFGKFMRLGAHVHGVKESTKTKLLSVKKAEGAVARQEKQELNEERKQMVAGDKLAKRSKAAELHDVTWGLRASADPPRFRSPNALVY